MEKEQEKKKAVARAVVPFEMLASNYMMVRAKINEMLVIYGQLPSYRAMLDREGAKGPADIALAGDENYLRGAIKRIEDIGVTDLNASIVPTEAGAMARTLEFLSSMKT